jgi:hypothetical protein
MASAVVVSTMTDTRPRWRSGFVAFGFADVIIGLSATALADFVPVFNLLAMIAGALGVAALLYCIVQPRSVKVYDILSATLMLAYGTGSLNSVVSYFLDNQELLGSSAISQYWYTRTLGLIVSACGCLHLVGRLDTDGYLLRAIAPTVRNRSRMVYFVVPVTILYCVLVARGRIGFQGSVSSEDAGPTVSPLAVFSLALATPAGALALAVALINPRGSRALLFFFSALLLLLQFGVGRRALLYSLVIFTMSALSVWRPKKLISIRMVFLIAIAIFTLQQLTTFFYAMRMASWSMHTRGMSRLAMLTLIPEAFKIYIDDPRGDLKANIQSNIKTRTFVLQYLTDISRREAERGPLYGEDLERALIVATPSMLYREKHVDKLFEVEEGLINPRFGFPIRDEANSVFTAGVADFGVFGIFLYPIVLCIALSLILRLIYRWAPPISALLVGMAIGQMLLSSEADISFYFVSLRNIGLILGVSWLFFGGEQKPVSNFSVLRSHQPDTKTRVR